MARPKALLPWRGSTMIAYLVGVMREAIDEVLVVSSATLPLPELDARVVVDREPGLGPLGGIREALHATMRERIVVASTDAPFLSADFVRFLLSHSGTVACRVGGRVQPFPAVYETHLAAAADELIGQSRMRPLFLLEAAGYRRIEEDELESTQAFRGFNTPDEYREALRSDGQDEGAD